MTKTHAAQRPWGVCLFAAAIVSLASTAALAQSSPGGSTGSSASGGSSSSGGNSAQAVQQGQQLLYGASGSNGAQPTQNDFRGSVVQGKATGTTLDLSLDEAIRRGLRNNLGQILRTTAVGSARGQKLEQLQNLLPTINGAASITVEQVNLAAFGLKFPGLNPIIGPFQVVDFRAYLTQNVLNVQSIQNYIASKHSFTSTLR